MTLVVPLGIWEFTKTYRGKPTTTCQNLKVIVEEICDFEQMNRFSFIFFDIDSVI